MVLPCENITTIITHNRSTEYILLEIEEFDKFFLFKFLQLLFYSLEIYFRIVLDFRIFRVILKMEQLQTSANTAIFVFLVSDLVLIIHYAIFAFVVLIKETLYIHKAIAEMEAFLNTFFGIFNYLCLTVMTVEKFLYTNFPFKHMRFFNIEKTIMYMLLCTIPTGLYCIGIHYTFHVHYMSNTLSMFYCFYGSAAAIRHLFWIIPVIFILIIMYCHISIMVDLCHNQCHIPQLPGFTLDLMDIDFVGRFVKAAASVVILTTSVFVDLMLRVLFQYIEVSTHILRSIWVLSVLLRMLNPLFILGGNTPLRNYVFNSGFKRSPTWLRANTIINAKRRVTLRRAQQSDMSADKASNTFDISNICSKNVKCIAKETSV